MPYLSKELGPGVTLNLPVEDFDKPEPIATRYTVSMFAHLMEEMSFLSLMPKEPKKPTLYTPSDYNGVYALRRLYQTFDLRFPRDPILQDMFNQDLEFQNRLRKSTGIYIFGELIKAELEAQKLISGYPVFWGPNPFPYQVPSDTLHKLQWFEHGTPESVQAWNLAEMCVEEGVGIGDIVILRNPPFAQSAPEAGHNHLIIKYKPSYKNLLVNAWDGIDNF